MSEVLSKKEKQKIYVAAGVGTKSRRDLLVSIGKLVDRFPVLGKEFFLFREFFFH